MPFCVEAYGCAMLGGFGDVLNVNPGDCSVDGQTVTGLLWQIRNPPLPAGTMSAAVLPAAACYSSAADVALVKEIQGAAGLPQNGVVDDATLSALTTAANAMQGPDPLGPLPTPKVVEDPLTITGNAGAKSGSTGAGWLALAVGGLFLLGGKKRSK